MEGFGHELFGGGGIVVASMGIFQGPQVLHLFYCGISCLKITIHDVIRAISACDSRCMMYIFILELE